MSSRQSGRGININIAAKRSSTHNKKLERHLKNGAHAQIYIHIYSSFPFRSSFVLRFLVTQRKNRDRQTDFWLAGVRVDPWPTGPLSRHHKEISFSKREITTQTSEHRGRCFFAR